MLPKTIMQPPPNAPNTHKIAILIPCHNEELTIVKVIADFRRELPDAEIYVFDNASVDKTAELAREAGAHISYVKQLGKGNVVKAMYNLIDADIYVMVDGDDTYPAEAVHQLIAPIISQKSDMVVGSRLLSASNSEFKALNKAGNQLFLRLLNLIFGVQLTDILSGFRAMSRELVEVTPILSTGFEIETELTFRTLEYGYVIREIPTQLRNRPVGSYSKIKISRDGLRILGSILVLFRDYRPIYFFGAVGIAIFIIGLILGVSVINEFLRTGLVPRLPTAILAASLVLLSMLILVSGLILDTINRRFMELNFQMRRLTRRRRSSA